MKKRPRKKAERPITKLQADFCEALIQPGVSQRQAYLSVYQNVKKPETADVCASKLLKITKVQAYYQKLLAKREAHSVISSARILDEEGRLAFYDLGEIFEGETLLPPNKIPEDIRRAISGIEIKREEVLGITRTTYKYRFHSKDGALARLEKIKGLYERDNAQRNPLEALLGLKKAFSELEADELEAILRGLQPD